MKPNPPTYLGKKGIFVKAIKGRGSKTVNEIWTYHHINEDKTYETDYFYVFRKLDEGEVDTRFPIRDWEGIACYVTLEQAERLALLS